VERAVGSALKSAAPIDEEIVADLRKLVDEVDPILHAREIKLSDLKRTFEVDDIFPQLLKITNQLTAKSSAVKIDLAHFEPTFQEELRSKYGGFKQLAEDEETTQKELLEAIISMNRLFVACKKGNAGWDRREMALKNLHDGYQKYRKLLDDMRSAIKVQGQLFVWFVFETGRPCACSRHSSLGKLVAHLHSIHLQHSSMAVSKKNSARFATSAVTIALRESFRRMNF